MSNIIDRLIEILSQYALVLPLELFVLIGSFVEEVISPIPSPFILTLTGSLAAEKGNISFLYLIVLALIGAFGKTIGSLVFYIFADKIEDIVVVRYGKFFGVNHKLLEKVGKKFSSNKRGDIVLIGLRALPIMPALPVSLVAGLIKIPMNTYLFGTFVGNTIRNMLFIYFGFAGVEAFKNIIDGFDKVESIIQIVIFLTIGIFIAWIYYKRSRLEKE